MHLHPIAFGGLMIACAAVSSGLSIAGLGRPAPGLAVLGGGGVLGAVLFLVGRGLATASAAPSVAPTPPSPPPSAPEPAASAPARARVGETTTVSQSFVAESSPAATAGLAEIYAALAKPGVLGYLLVIAGADRGRTFPVGISAISIGRGPENVFKLTDTGVSTSQAVVVHDGRKLVIRDAGSKNGTFVNNERVTEARALESCDVVVFGKTKILVAVG